VLKQVFKPTQLPTQPRNQHLLNKLMELLLPNHLHKLEVLQQLLAQLVHPHLRPTQTQLLVDLLPIMANQLLLLVPLLSLLLINHHKLVL
jgi:hypothetical protein